MPRGKKGRVIVITGASAGVGRATARAFAREGACLALIARGRAGLEGARRDVEELGGQAVVLPTDVADAAGVEQAAEQVEQKLGPIDVWVNNAITSVFSPINAMTPEEFKRVTDVTYLGYVYGTLAALKRMRPRNRGVIIQVGSALAYRGIPLQSAYCAAKHAIQGFIVILLRIITGARQIMIEQTGKKRHRPNNLFEPVAAGGSWHPERNLRRNFF
jgi:NAD(P)-dependent dehydrogenase (short-subunit alcohol dehydrogenase family)